MKLVDLEPRDGSGRSDVSDPSTLLVVPDWRWLVPRTLCIDVIGMNGILNKHRATGLSRTVRADVKAPLVLICVEEGD